MPNPRRPHHHVGLGSHQAVVTTRRPRRSLMEVRPHCHDWEQEAPRHQHDHGQAPRLQWAVVHNVPIIKWKHKFATNIAPHQEELCRKGFATNLEGIFVQGAPAMILNNNLNPARGLANGTQCFNSTVWFSAPPMMEIMSCSAPRPRRSGRSAQPSHR